MRAADDDGPIVFAELEARGHFDPEMNRTTATNVEVSVTLWVVSIGMGLAFVASGAMKLVVSKRSLALWGASWVDDFSSGTVTFVGLTEIAGGLAIIVPVALGIPFRLAAAAGTAGLIVVMLGAAVVHARRREPGMIALNLALLALTAAALWDRTNY